MNMLSMTQRPRRQKPGLSGAMTGAVVQFPFHGEALLAKLADDLRETFGREALERDGMHLEMSRGPSSRLSIDDAACVEFRGGQLGYRMSIDVSFGTMIALETLEFETVVEFVGQYVAARLSDAALAEPTA
jgi:hypothetical protein